MRAGTFGAFWRTLGMIGMVSLCFLVMPKEGTALDLSIDQGVDIYRAESRLSEFLDLLKDSNNLETGFKTFVKLSFNFDFLTPPPFDATPKRWFLGGRIGVVGFPPESIDYGDISLSHHHLTIGLLGGRIVTTRIRAMIHLSVGGGFDLLNSELGTSPKVTEASPLGLLSGGAGLNYYLSRLLFISAWLEQRVSSSVTFNRFRIETPPDSGSFLPATHQNSVTQLRLGFGLAL